MKCEKCGHENGGRTGQQNRALHKFLSMLSDELNRNGLTLQVIFSTTADRDWSLNTVKEEIWRKMQKAVLGKDSTTELKKQEDIDNVYDHLNRWFSENPKVQETDFQFPPFPSAEQLEAMDDTFTNNRGLR